jgi:hypothetical protein
MASQRPRICTVGRWTQRCLLHWPQFHHQRIHRQQPVGGCHPVQIAAGVRLFPARSLNGPDKAVYICAKLGHPDPACGLRLPRYIRFGPPHNGAEMRSRFFIGADNTFHGVRKKGKLAQAVTGSHSKTFKSRCLKISGHRICCATVRRRNEPPWLRFCPHCTNEYHSDNTGLAINGGAYAPFTADDRFQTNHVSATSTTKVRYRPNTRTCWPGATHGGGCHSTSCAIAKQSGQTGHRAFRRQKLQRQCHPHRLHRHFHEAFSPIYSINKEGIDRRPPNPAVGGSDLIEGPVQNGTCFFRHGALYGRLHLGGYLLQGGYGWNGRKTGHCLPERPGPGHRHRRWRTGPRQRNGKRRPVLCGARFGRGLLWRSGQILPETLTHCRLTVPSLPTIFPSNIWNDVYRWAYEVGPSIPKAVEFQMLMSKNMMNVMGPGHRGLCAHFCRQRRRV